MLCTVHNLLKLASARCQGPNPGLTLANPSLSIRILGQAPRRKPRPSRCAACPVEMGAAPMTPLTTSRTSGCRPGWCATSVTFAKARQGSLKR
jgi:hypothetical protein